MKSIYREYFRVPKDKHIPTKVFMANLILAVVSIVGCTFALFATSYAWFSMQVSSEMNIIEAAYFDVTVTEPDSVQVMTMDQLSDMEKDASYVTDLAMMDEHLFYIEPFGTASTGYCAVSLKYQDSKQLYYTQQIPRGSYMELTIKARKGTEIEFYPYWGDLDYHGVNYDKRYGTVKSEITTFKMRRRTHTEEGPSILGPATPYLEYRFPQYATLGDVAEFYEIDMQDILIFNGIEDPLEIEIGDWLYLPYVDEDAEIYVALPPDTEHVVQEGETVASIAEMYDISIEELIAYNELEPYVEEPVENEIPADDVPLEETKPVYVLTPGQIILIPYYMETGFTSPDSIREEDLMNMFPQYSLNDMEDVEQNEFDDQWEKEPEDDDEGILTLDGQGKKEQDKSDGQKKPEQTITPTEPTQPGVLTLAPTGQNSQPAVQPEQPNTDNQGVLTLN